MRRFIRLILSRATATALACNDAATALSYGRGESQANRAGFSALAPGDSTQLTFRSDGCFHHFYVAVTIVRDATGADVVGDSLEANLAPGWRIQRPARLSDEELAQLDSLVAYYRAVTTTGCTTVDRISFTTVRGETVTRESFVDGSCGSYDTGILSLPRLFPLVKDSAMARPNER
jgi:hypothetical protein